MVMMLFCVFLKNLCWTLYKDINHHVVY